MAKAPKPVFVCQECGSQSSKWLGRCPDCEAWNSFVEERPVEVAAGAGLGGVHRYSLPGGAQGARRYADVALSDTPRLTAGIDEFDRVLGGGIVPGSLVLLGGEPGIGKSTLLLQAAANFAHAHGPVLYASGEESEHQIKARGERLGVGEAPLFLLAETCVERILEEIGRVRPRLLVVDSIQTVFSLKFQSAPGSIGQVREAATQFLFTAKGHDLPTFLVGHVTKDGSLAGPKVLEHVVDTVLYFEGERHHSHRVVRAIKNRFGAVSELGVFEMTGTGLRPVPNPSQLFLAERPTATPGSAVLCCVEGSRPLLVEVQALVSTATYGTARRMAVGIDTGRRVAAAGRAREAGRAGAGRRGRLRQHRRRHDHRRAGGRSGGAGGAGLERAQPPDSPGHGGVRRSRDWVGKCAACRRPDCGCARRGSSAFPGCCCPSANLDDDSRRSADDAGTTLIGVRHVGEALDALLA